MERCWDGSVTFQENINETKMWFIVKLNEKVDFITQILKYM